MSSFNCSKCQTPILDSPEGYTTFCEHYPKESMSKRLIKCKAIHLDGICPDENMSKECDYLESLGTIECGNCHPEKFEDCKVLEKKYPGIKKCDCICHQPPKPEADWEERFDKEFTELNMRVDRHSMVIKDFIRQLLADQAKEIEKKLSVANMAGYLGGMENEKERLIREIEKKVVPEERKVPIGSQAMKEIAWKVKGFNEAIKIIKENFKKYV